MAVGLSVRYGTRPPIGFVALPVVDWSKYRLGYIWTSLNSGRLWAHVVGGNLHGLETPLTVPLHKPNSRLMHGVKTVQRDCERVFEVHQGQPVLGCRLLTQFLSFFSFIFTRNIETWFVCYISRWYLITLCNNRNVAESEIIERKFCNPNPCVWMM